MFSLDMQKVWLKKSTRNLTEDWLSGGQVLPPTTLPSFHVLRPSTLRYLCMVGSGPTGTAAVPQGPTSSTVMPCSEWGLAFLPLPAHILGEKKCLGVNPHPATFHPAVQEGSPLSLGNIYVSQCNMLRDPFLSFPKILTSQDSEWVLFGGEDGQVSSSPLDKISKPP